MFFTLSGYKKATRLSTLERRVILLNKSRVVGRSDIIFAKARRDFMSTQIAPIPEPPQPKEIPQLTDAYRKAHKGYVLTSGLLASWELIGISLDMKGKWGIEFQSPKAIPLILVILVLYCGYKVIIEWLQCDRERRGHPAAKLDYVIAHVIGFGAITILVLQYLLRIQIVDVIITQNPLDLIRSRRPILDLMIGGSCLLLCYTLSYLATQLLEQPGRHFHAKIHVILAVFVLFVFLLWLAMNLVHHAYKLLFFSIGGATIDFAIFLYFRQPILKWYVRRLEKTFE